LVQVNVGRKIKRIILPGGLLVGPQPPAGIGNVLSRNQGGDRRKYEERGENEGMFHGNNEYGEF
jgi:hypothetical protein